MIGKSGGGNPHRVVLGLAFLTTAAILWLGSSRAPSSSFEYSGWTDSLVVTDGAVEMEPRLNTTWHSQIALEMGTDRSGLQSVETPYGVLDRTRVALLSK